MFTGPRRSTTETARKHCPTKIHICKLLFPRIIAGIVFSVELQISAAYHHNGTQKEYAANTRNSSIFNEEFPGG